MSEQNNFHKFAYLRPLARLTQFSVRDLVLLVGPVVLITLVGIGAAYWLVRPAPPKTITITSGPKGSIFQLTAEKYRNPGT